MENSATSLAPDSAIAALEDGRHTLDLLLGRRSVSALQDRAPTGHDLDLILDLGLRAPDHGRLRPWRFVLIRGDAAARRC